MLTALRLHHFRCYDTLRWEIPAEGALLLGDNAQGKTSLLEALCLALSLHSPRASRLERLAQHGSPHFGLALDSDEGNRRLLWQKGQKISMQVDGAERRDYADFLRDAHPVTWLGNGDMALVSGSAEQRRAFLNFLGAQWHPHYRQALQAYRRALRARNALLRHPRRDRAALDSYARILGQHGSVLVALRRQLLELLLPHVRRRHHLISGQVEEVGLRYAPAVEHELTEAICAATADDERQGFTGPGPHRDDFLLSINGTAAADYASEGQQRTLAISLLLAQNTLLHDEVGRSPLLLIDDIFGELDPPRRRALLRELPADSQVFITTTHLGWLGDSPCPLPLFEVSKGGVHPR